MEPVTILLVEDEGLLLFEFEEALTEAGFNVVAFSSGTKAVEYLRSAEVAARGVVTDIRLSDRAALDGWEVARIAWEIDPEVAVVYMSGHGAVDWPSKGVPNSIVLEKPFAIAQLITAVSQLLNEG
ncbi:response regulator [Sinorhizobium meliloti]|uniref:response regulator n=1 Tax=Rhizobium meliloti TaxID=382 RepID=UPI000FD6FCD3|nr:response regulator [Sinorhizobium meliloti]RVH28127.1 response regulator [Sinorhizobium meliloti]